MSEEIGGNITVYKDLQESKDKQTKITIKDLYKTHQNNQVSKRKLAYEPKHKLLKSIYDKYVNRFTNDKYLNNIILKSIEIGQTKCIVFEESDHNSILNHNDIESLLYESFYCEQQSNRVLPSLLSILNRNIPDCSTIVDKIVYMTSYDIPYVYTRVILKWESPDNDDDDDEDESNGI